MKLSVSGFLSNPSKPAAILDSAANMLSSLGQLEGYAADIRSISLTDKKPVLSLPASEIVSYASVLGKVASNYSIVLSDSTPPTLALSWAQYTADSKVLGKIAASSQYNLSLAGVPAGKVASLGHNGHVVAMTVTDTAQHVAGNLGAIGKYDASITSVSIVDTGAHIANNLTALEHGFGKLNQLKITLTDSSVPVLKLSAAQLSGDASVLNAITSPFTIQIVDSAQNVTKYLAALETYSSQISSISLTGSTPTLNLSAAQYNANSDALAEISSRYHLNVSGSAGIAATQIPAFTMRAPPGTSGAVTLTAYVSINGGAPVSLGALTATGSSAVQFQPQGLNSQAGDSWSFSVTATNAQGNTVAGQIEMTPGYFSGQPVNNGYAATVSITFLTVSATGGVTGLPKAYSAKDTHYYVLEGTSGATVSMAELAAADKGNKVLHQYILAGKVTVAGVTGAVQPEGLNVMSPSVQVNGHTLIPDLGKQLDAGQYAIMANISNPSSSTTVQMWLSDGVNTYQLGSQTLSSSQPYAGFSGADLNTNGVVLSAGSGATGTAYKLFFTDASGNGVPGNAISGLQLAVSSPTGGSPAQWITAPSTASGGINLEVGTVAQVLAYAAAHPAGTTWYFIEDSINNIHAASAALNSLVNAQQVVGAYISGGIAPAGNGYIMSQWPAAIQIGGSSQFVRVFGANTGNWQAHTTLAVQTTDSGVSHTLQLYDNGTALGSAQTLTSDGSSTLGVALPAGMTLSPGTHNLTATLDGAAVNLGVVAPGGGLPVSYAASLNVWVGTVSQLPTSLSAVAANTLYVIQDTAANLAALGSSSVESGAALALAASGNLVFEVSGGQLTSYQQQLIEENNLNILNLSTLSVQDTLLGLEHVPVLAGGDSLQINDDMARLLYSATAIESAYPTSGSAGQHNPLAIAVSGGHVTLTDTLAALTDTANQTALQTQYGQASIGRVVVADSVADYTSANLTADSLVLQTFAGSLGAALGFEVKDSLANIQTALAQNGSQFLSTYTAGIDVIDSVRNLETAYANGSLSALETAAATVPVKLAVEDSLANLQSLFSTAGETGLISQLQNVTVVDTAQNILNAYQNSGSGLNPLAAASNIIIQDSYANVLAASQSNSGLLGSVSEIDLTSGATVGQGALQVNIGNTGGIGNGMGALPEVMLPFMSGTLSATEASDGNGGTLVTITDTQSHSVSIDLIGVVDNAAGGSSYTQGGWYHV
ncbi:MAG: hypothetical protein PHW13_02960 [Methylococcales bacterium]|nr:hypothetical protein [Methylococcales bacterium]